MNPGSVEMATAAVWFFGLIAIAIALSLALAVIADQIPCGDSTLLREVVRSLGLDPPFEEDPHR